MWAGKNTHNSKILQVLNEADMLTECVDRVCRRNTDDREASLNYQTPGSLPVPANGGILLYQRPLRPLSAYNLFFQLQRERIIKYGNSREEYETIPFTVQDMERVVRERYQNWAGIVPSAMNTSAITTSNKKKSAVMPSFGELSSQIASAWKKLDKDTKQLFQEFASNEKREYKKQNVNITQISPPVNHELMPSGALPLPSLVNRSYSYPQIASTRTNRIVSPTLMSPNVKCNAPNSRIANIGNRMQLMDGSNESEDASLQQRKTNFRNLDGVNKAQNQLLAFKQYQEMISRQYDSMMAKMARDLPISCYRMPNECTESNDHNFIADTFFKDSEHLETNSHHHGASYQPFPDNIDYDLSFSHNEDTTDRIDCMPPLLSTTSAVTPLSLQEILCENISNIQYDSDDE